MMREIMGLIFGIGCAATFYILATLAQKIISAVKSYRNRFTEIRTYGKDFVIKE